MDTELIFREIANAENIARKQAENWGEYLALSCQICMFADMMLALRFLRIHSSRYVNYQDFCSLRIGAGKEVTLSSLLK